MEQAQVDVGSFVDNLQQMSFWELSSLLRQLKMQPPHERDDVLYRAVVEERRKKHANMPAPSDALSNAEFRHVVQ